MGPLALEDVPLLFRRFQYGTHLGTPSSPVVPKVFMVTFDKSKLE